jgi:hypothetical protein
MITIQVTQDDIDNGVRLSGSWCPIALACIRTIGLNYDQIWQNYWSQGNMTENVRNFVIAFDKKQPVQPFSFELPDSVTTSEAP